MRKSKKTQADQRGARAKRNPRAAGPQRETSSRQPLDDRYGDSDGAVDSEMELDTDKYETPIPRR